MKLRERIGNYLSHIKIKQSLAYTFLFVFIIPFIIIYTIFIFVIYNTMRDAELKRARSNLELTEKNFVQMLDNVSSFSDRIYINKRLQKLLLTEYSDLQILYDDYAEINFLEDYLHGNQNVSNFRIYTKNPTLLENQFIQKTTPNIENSDWYRLAENSNGYVFWNYREDQITKKNYLCLIRSLWSSNGLLTGVLVVNVNPDAIYQTLVDKNLMNFIVFDYKLIYSSSTKAFEAYEQQLVKFVYQNDNTSLKMTNMIINEEKVGVVAKDFYPRNSSGAKIEIINVIPIIELIASTRKISYYSLIVLVIILILSGTVLISYSHYIDSRVSKINNEVKQLVDKNFKIANSIGGNDEFEQIYRTIKTMSVNIDELIDKLYINTVEKNNLALQQSEISFKMLSNQINPHFLFNTLETIRMKALAASDKEVPTMLKLLASLLRYNLSVKGQPVPMLKELEAVQNYLTIQHMRFGERVSYSIIPLCDVRNKEILPLLIQPIVENSFSHGLEDKVSGGFIYILIDSEIINEKEIIKIIVKDNGSGIDEEKLEELRFKLANYHNQDTSKSIGLINVQSRIKMYYGEEFGINIESDIGEGTTVTITI